ncbi:MAG: hypothetical protein FJY67_05130 [Calditrichaeota bacterium]|nr:hypothetical protein [Calditrichota bacterium]
MRISVYAIILLGGAVALTASLGAPGLGAVKLNAMLLSLIAFAPPFYYISREMKRGEFNRIFGFFVGGFFFKVIVVAGGLWIGIGRLDWPMLDATAGALSVLFALQILEAGYFYHRGHREAQS